MRSMRRATRSLSLAVITTVGLTAGAAAQLLGPGMPMPGQGHPMGMGGFGAPQPQREPPCMAQFNPLRAEAEKRANAVKEAMQKKATREQACVLVKRFAEAEAKLVNFVVANTASCGIPAQVAPTLKQNHARTLQSQHQVCDAAAAGPPKPTGPGLSEALGTGRSGTLDPFAPQSGGLDTLTGNVLSR